MTVRTTNFGVMVEYQINPHVRTTNMGVMVEYHPTPHVRTTNMGVMIEYYPIQHIRTSDVGLMVEYIPTDYIRTSTIGLMVEYDPYWHIRTSNIGLMVEYCGFLKIINAIDIWPNGDVYVTGRFTYLGGVWVTNVARWDGTTWYPLDIGLYGPSCNEREGLALKVHPSGDVYVGGKFHTAGGDPCYHLARWDGTWYPVGPEWGLNDDVYTIEIRPDGSEIYFGGDFTDEWGDPGSGLTRVAKYTVATGIFEPMGEGFDDTVLKLKLSPSGELYAVGKFLNSGSHSVKYVAVFRGGAWVPLGNNAIDDQVDTLEFDSKGTLVIGGHFQSIGTLSVRGMAYWNGSNWLRPDLVFPPEYTRVMPKPDPSCPTQISYDSTNIMALTFGEDDDLFAGGESLSYMPGGYVGPLASDYSGITRITNTGSAETNPRFYIQGSGRLRYIENETSKVKIYFDLVILDDEEIFIDLELGTIQSTVRGDLSYGLQHGSDYVKLTLLPGENKMAVFISDSVDPIVRVYYTPTHWSADSSKSGEAF